MPNQPKPAEKTERRNDAFAGPASGTAIICGTVSALNGLWFAMLLGNVKGPTWNQTAAFAIISVLCLIAVEVSMLRHQVRKLQAAVEDAEAAEKARFRARVTGV